MTKLREAISQLQLDYREKLPEEVIGLLQEIDNIEKGNGSYMVIEGNSIISDFKKFKGIVRTINRERFGLVCRYRNSTKFYPFNTCEGLKEGCISIAFIPVYAHESGCKTVRDALELFVYIPEKIANNN